MLISEMMLYRGDSSAIPEFHFDKTDPEALFGPGLYLSSDPEVAHDYTAARGDERIFPMGGQSDEKSRTVKELIQKYVEHTARSMFDSDAYQRKWKLDHHIGDYAGMSSNFYHQLQNDGTIAAAESYRKSLPEALKNVRTEMPNLRVAKLTTGELVLLKKDRTAALSGFDIPNEYMARLLHAERPLPDNVLAAIRDLWISRYPNDNGDLRNADGDRVNFDSFVKAYKTTKLRRAWADDDDPEIGGKGKNPSLDDLRNGTHGGRHVFVDSSFTDDRKNSMALIKTLMDLGYVGFEYDGGKRLGQHIRGGGGRLHQAFVFWDMKTVNGFRKDNLPMPNLKGVNARSLPR